MPEQSSLLVLPDTEWCRQLDTVLSQLPSPTPSADAPRGDAALAALRGTLPAPLLDELAAAVANPVQIIETAAWRVVVVLRLYASVIERSTGHVRAAMLRDDGRLTVIARPEPDVRLLNSPQGDHWSRYWLRGWCWRQGVVVDPRDLLDAVADASGRLWRHAHRRLDLRAMRRAIAVAMDYWPVAWHRAVRLAHAAGIEPVHAHYNAALRLAAPLDLLDREAPNLAAPWFALACEGVIDAADEPNAALKRWVGELTGSSRAWRSLAASPAPLWRVGSRRRQASVGQALAETVRLVQRFVTSRPVPLPLLRAVVARLDPLVPLRAGRIGFYPFALHAARSAIAGNGWSRFLDELDAVDAWFDVETPVLDKRQRHRGWPWLVRKARAWAEMQARQHQAGEPLIPVLPPLSAGGYTFTAARTPFDMWHAGRVLRNCLGNSRQQLRQAYSDALLVLATRQADGRLRAALTLHQPRPQAALQVAEAHGFANGPLPREMRPLLPLVTEHFERQRCARFLPWQTGVAETGEPPLARCPLLSPFGGGSCELRLTAAGQVQIGHWLRDFTTDPLRERFDVAREIVGGQAQRLADRAMAQSAVPVRTLEELAAAIAGVLTAAPGLDHWLTAFGALRPYDDEEDYERRDAEFLDEGSLDRAVSRDAVLEVIDHLARHDRDRVRCRRRRIAVQ